METTKPIFRISDYITFDGKPAKIISTSADSNGKRLGFRFLDRERDAPHCSECYQLIPNEAGIDLEFLENDPEFQRRAVLLRPVY